MQRTHFRGVVQPQGSAQRPIAGVSSGNAGQGVYVDSGDQQGTEDSDLIDITDEVLAQQAQDTTGRYRHRQAVRNASLRFSHREASVYRFGDIDLKPGTCVELREAFGDWKAEFVETKSIWICRSNGSVIIRGLPFTRNRNLRGALENKRNEVCQILEVDPNDQRPEEAQALIEISPQQILQVRALYKTNVAYPLHYYGNDDRRWLAKTDQEREEQGPLTCRWKLCVQYKDTYAQRDSRSDVDAAFVRDGAFIRVREAEVDKRLPTVTDKELRVNWRGKRYRGGSHKPSGSGHRQFTFGDAFCGAGGASRGAVMAGLKLEFGVDNWDVACSTWKRNFPSSHMFKQHIGDWIGNHTISWRTCPIDILHISPPCQPFSPLAYPHAAAGNTNDDAKAVLLSCGDIIEKIRPRLFTLEQTFGITQDAHREYLNTLIQAFTRASHGYSVQWRIVSLVEYGLPQTRKRLIMTGACPGEQMPPWPPATHAQRPTGSQKHFVTEAQALRGLSRSRDPLHNVAHTIVRNNPPRNSNMPFSKTITGKGTDVSHFSGLRDYTLRELACLQGFPASHQFVGNKTQIRKQIGNAFPSCVVKAIYNHLRAWLEQVDGVQGVPPAQAEARRPSAPRIAQPAIAQPAVAQPAIARTRGLPAAAGTQKHTNGDLTEEEALEFALQESRSESLPAAAIVSSVEVDRSESVVSAVGPLMERISIAPSSHRDKSPAKHRSRSYTLGRSASPHPSRSAGLGAASQKRSLDSMHDGDADEVMKEASPPKREKVHVVDTRDNNADSPGVNDSKILSRLPQYVGPQGPFNTEVDEVADDQWSTANHDDDHQAEEELWTF